MKKLLVVIFVLSIGLNSILAQINFFEKTNINDLKLPVNEKLEKLKTRKEIKQWEVVKLKQSVSFSKKVKGTLNIFNKNFEFEVTKDFGTDINNVQGYKAEIKDGGSAIISVSKGKILISLWYLDRFYSVETVEDDIQFVTEIDLGELARNDCKVEFR